MHSGRIVRSGTPAQIADGHPSTISFRTPAAGLPDVAGGDLRARRVAQSEGITTLETDDLQHTLTVLLDAAARTGVHLDQLSARTASLESVFLQIADSDPDDPAATDVPAHDQTTEVAA